MYFMLILSLSGFGSVIAMEKVDDLSEAKCVEAMKVLTKPKRESGKIEVYCFPKK